MILARFGEVDLDSLGKGEGGAVSGRCGLIKGPSSIFLKSWVRSCLRTCARREIIRRPRSFSQKRNQVGLSCRIDRHDAHRRKRAPSALAFLSLRYAVLQISNASSLAATASAARGPTAPVEFALAQAHGAAIRYGGAACVTAKKPDGRLQSAAERTTREEDVMLTADADVSSALIMRRCGVPRRFG